MTTIEECHPATLQNEALRAEARDRFVMMGRPVEGYQGQGVEVLLDPEVPLLWVATAGAVTVRRCSTEDVAKVRAGHLR